MKKVFLLLFVSTLSLAACNTAPQKMAYEDFYNKTQTIEEHFYSRATMVIAYDYDLTQEGSSSKSNQKKNI